MRLDRWLWQARFFKTRTLATETVDRGRVRLNGAVVRKAATRVGSGDMLTIVQGNEARLVEILGLPERRGPASEAATLYRERHAAAGDPRGSPPGLQVTGRGTS